MRFVFFSLLFAFCFFVRVVLFLFAFSFFHLRFPFFICVFFFIFAVSFLFVFEPSGPPYKNVQYCLFCFSSCSCC